MTAEEVKTIRDEVERRYWEQNINEMSEFYTKIKECLFISNDKVANTILDYGCWWNIDFILSRIEEHPDWKEVFHDEIDRLEHNRAYFVKRDHELRMPKTEYKLPWWKRLFRKNTKQNSTNEMKENN